MEQIYFELSRILRGMWRYRWHGIVVAWVVVLVGVVVIYKRADVYEASARVYVDTSSQLRLLLDDQVVDSGVGEQLRYVRETMLGRPQLERLAHEVGLATSNTSADELAYLVALLGSGVMITSDSDQANRRPWNAPPQQGSTYLIVYQHHNRELAIRVVDTLLKIFVEDTQGAKRTNSREAGEFLSTQLREYEQRLQVAESALAEFNRRNYDRLPTHQGGYFASLLDARAQLEESRRALETAESGLLSIERQMRGGEPRLLSSGQLDPNSIEARTGEAQRRLDELRLRFTDQHPDVVAARESLNSLQAQMDALYSGEVDFSSASNNPVFQALQISRNELNAEVATLNAEVRQKQARVEELQGLLDEMPEVEAELVRLNRDYNVVQEHYQSLLNSLEREKLSRQVVESETFTFRIIDPPSAPLKPVSVSRPLLLVVALVLSLGVGFVLAFGLAELNPVFATKENLSAKLGLPVLGTVSSVTANQTTYSFLLFGLLSASLVASVLALAAIESLGLLS